MRDDQPQRNCFGALSRHDAGINVLYHAAIPLADVAELWYVYARAAQLLLTIACTPALAAFRRCFTFCLRLAFAFGDRASSDNAQEVCVTEPTSPLYKACPLTFFVSQLSADLLTLLVDGLTSVMKLRQRLCSSIAERQSGAPHTARSTDPTFSHDCNTSTTTRRRRRSTPRAACARAQRCEWSMKGGTVINAVAATMTIAANTASEPATECVWERNWSCWHGRCWGLGFWCCDRLGCWYNVACKACSCWACCLRRSTSWRCNNWRRCLGRCSYGCCFGWR